MRVPAEPAWVPIVLLALAALAAGCTQGTGAGEAAAEEAAQAVPLRAVQDEETGSISIYREGEEEPIVTQNAGAEHRPFLHPIVAPDGKGLATQYSPGHHPHQTGLYWGFTRVNGEPMDADTLRQWFYRRDKPEEIAKAVGRDYFHNPGGDYWRRDSATVVTEAGTEVQWQTVYGMLDAEGKAFMTETQNWSMRAEEDRFILDLEWAGEAHTDVSINEMSYGGMFLRMPWTRDIPGEAVNAARQRNRQAEGQRAMWVDVGMQVEGRDDFLHVAIFDHPMNAGYPQTWRVDGQLGVGPTRARMGDWHIPEGATEVIRHRLIVYTGELNDLELTEDWEEYTGAAEGSYSTSSLWGIAQREAKQEKFLTPEEAVDAMTVRDGFKVNAWASEPMITQPMAFAWDDRGRMWVAENRDYETRGRGFSGSGDSRILILEDTDRDGAADSKKVFAEGIPFPAALAVGFDGVFVGAPPHLLFLPDRDGDDVADMDDAEILLTGWGIRDRHETINSFHWGPDGWLYGLEGFATPSRIRKPGPDETIYGHNDPFPDDLFEYDGVDINGGVWRYHPTKDRFEVVAHGFSNPWGIDYDAKGQIFITACVIPHLFHVVPGGIYHRQGGSHFNPYVYGDIRTIVNHRHRSAHGGARVYLSDAFPEEHHGRLFMANIHEHAVLSDELEPKGSGFVAHHGEDFLLANNKQWVGFSMEIGPGGDVYVLDWHDADICGNDVQHKETGRIFRITPEQSLAEDWEGRYDDVKTMSNEQLVALQLSKSSWHARRARVVLQGRAARGEVDAPVHDALREMFASNPDGDLRLRAMWALHVTGGFTPDELMTALDDEDQHVRAWAIQLLTEDHDAPAAATEKFVELADRDASPIVRLYLAAALQRVEHDVRWSIAEHLVMKGDDADDHNIPKMIWFGIEPLVPEDPMRALRLARTSQIPMLTENIARRAVDADELGFLVTSLDDRSDARPALLRGMLAGLEGHVFAEPPDNWERVYGRLKRDRNVADLALEVEQQFGGVEVARQFLATLDDEGAPPEDRRRAIQGLADQQHQALFERLPALLDEPEVRIAALRAYAAFDGRWETGFLLLGRYDSFNADEKLAAVQTLASRPIYGRVLMGAIKEGSVPRRDVPAYVARQLHRVVGSGFLEVWGPITRVSSEKAAAIAKYTTILSDDAIATADTAHGEQMFTELCAVCHQMFGEGGLIGPDLTGSNRTELDYLLTNILDPSGDIQDVYQTLMVTTRDGRTYSGTVATKSPRSMTLRVVGQDEVVIAQSDIQSFDYFPLSMMPEGLLDPYTDDEVTNLVAYLMTAQEETSPQGP